MQRIIKRLLAASCLAALATGCSGPSSQLTAIQQDKEKLLGTIRTQRDAGRALQQQVASLETRLDQAEKELASRPGTTRLSSRPTDRAPAVKAESLPWRSPPAKGSSPAVEKTRTSSNSKSRASSASLASLAKQDDRLAYDAQSRTAQLNLPISFEKEGANLTAESKRQLDDVADLLRSDNAKDLRIMVTGYVAGRPSTTSQPKEGESRYSTARQLGASRAQAVADYLDRHGIAQERLGVTGIGAPSAGGAKADDLAASGGVQIHLLEPEATVVGWAPGQTLRR